jgi:hypothetical protein
MPGKTAFLEEVWRTHFEKAEMNYPAASHEVSTGKIRSKGEASFGELNPPMGD